MRQKHRKRALRWWQQRHCRYSTAHRERVTVRIGGKERVAVRLQSTDLLGGPRCTVTTPRLIGARSSTPDREIPVYIQCHALLRVQQRLSPVASAESRTWLAASFDNPTVVCTARRTPLLRCCIGDIPVGYLPVCIHDSKAIIMTFLFITCSATPEGRRLDWLLGTTRAEKKYLGLDRLSGFVQTDVLDSPSLRRRLVLAGCGGLTQDFAPYVTHPLRVTTGMASMVERYAVPGRRVVRRMAYAEPTAARGACATLP